MSARSGEAPEGAGGRRALWAALAVLYAAFIFALSATPGATLGRLGLPSWLLDLGHVPLYAGFTVLVLLAFAGSARGIRESLWPTFWSAGALVTYALSDEYHQRFVPGRSSSLSDLVRDLAGMLIALGLCHLLARRTSESGAARRPRAAGFARSDLLVVLSSCLFALLLYLPSLKLGFVNWDDNRYVADNPQIQGLTWEHVKSWWAAPYLGNYAPLTLASYALDHAIWGLDPLGYHLGNVLLHALCAALLAALLLAMRAPPLAAAVAAAVFAAHPAQVEVVSWVAERKSLLAVAFMLLALIVYARGARGERLSRGTLPAALLLYTAALLSKLSVVGLPGVLFLYDLGFRRGRFWVFLREKIPFLGVGAFLALITYKYQAKLNVAAFEWLGGSPSHHVATIASLFARYARIVLFPTQLSALYDPPAAARVLEPWSGAGFLILGLGAAAMLYALLRGRRALWWMGLLWLGFLPVAQLVPFWIRMADRYLQVPLAGIAAGAGLGAAALFSRLRAPGRRLAASVAIVVPLLAFSALTWQRQSVWQNGIGLWEDAMRKPPVHFRTYLNYAQALQNAGDYKRAIPYFERALAAEPDWILTLNWYGEACAKAGDLGRARALYRRAMAQTYELPENRVAAALGLANVLAQLGEYEKAMSAYQAALAVDPSEKRAHLGLARALRALGRTEDARRRLDRVIAVEPDDAMVQILQAGLEADEGRLQQARRRLDRVIASSEGAERADALQERARAFALEGKFQAALADISAALADTPPGLQRRNRRAAQTLLLRGEIPPVYPTYQDVPPDAR